LNEKLKKLYLLTVCAFLTAGAVAFGIQCWRAVHFPYGLEYGEGVVLWQTLQVTHPSKAFHRIEQYPHIPFNYTPLYHLVTRGFATFTDDPLSAGRWVSFLSGLGIAVAVGLLGWYPVRRSFSRFSRISAAVLSGLLCFNLSTIAWAQFMRVDMLALLFTFSGILLFVWAPRRTRWHYGAFLLFVLAGFAKQTQIAAPAACLLIAFALDWRRGARLLGFTVLLSGAGLAALALPTHGDALLNLFTYNRHPFIILNMLGLVQMNISAMAPLAAIALSVPVSMGVRIVRLPRLRRLTVLRSWLEKSWTRRAMAVLSLHLIFALAVSFTCGKRGATYNYFLEWNLAVCVLVGPVILFALRRIGNRTVSALHFVPLVLLLLFSTNGVASLAEELRIRELSAHARNSEQVVAWLRGLPGPVYSEDVTAVIRSGKEVVAEPDMITYLAQAGTWDERPFVRQLASGAFSAVIVTSSLDNSNCYSPAVKAAIEKAYTHQRDYGEFKIWLPGRASGGGLAAFPNDQAAPRH